MTIDDSSLDKLICCTFTYNKIETQIDSSGFGHANFQVVFVHETAIDHHKMAIVKYNHLFC